MKKQKENKRRINLGRNLPWLFLSILVIANVYLCINYATSGAVISHLEGQEASVNDEKSFLSEQLLRTASLKQIENKAIELGFSKPANILYLNGEESVAKLP